MEVSGNRERSKNPVLLVILIKCPGGLSLGKLPTGGMEIIFSASAAKQSAKQGMEASVSQREDRRTLCFSLCPSCAPAVWWLPCFSPAVLK